MDVMDTRATFTVDMGFHILYRDYMMGPRRVLLQDSCHLGYPAILTVAHVGP